MYEISIIGAGFVGVAHAAFLSKFYRRINLIDKNPNLISQLKAGEIPFASSDNQLKKTFFDAVNNKTIIPSGELSHIASSEAIFVSVSFDFSTKESSYANLQSLFRDIYSLAASQTLVVLETTVPPGTSEKVIVPELFKGSNQKDLQYVYSYERVMPGPNYLHSVEQLPKVFATINMASTQAYKKHLSLVNAHASHVQLGELISAELAKVYENTYRMVNIALVQEFTEFGVTVGANTMDILESIRARPTHNNIRFPGLAPGGYCLTKDPTFLQKSSDLFEINHQFPILEAAISTTSKQNEKVLEFLKQNLDKQSEYVFLGVSYLSGVGDLRSSSSLSIFKDLLTNGYSVCALDNYCLQYRDEIPGKLLDDLDLISGKKVILATRHPEVSLEKLKDCFEIIDINSCLQSCEKIKLRRKNVKISQYGEIL
jgi:UDP-N-acetyl-D-glucosamine dehydrogenase